MTKRKGFLFGDRTKTISSSDGSPIQVNAGNVRVETTGKVFVHNAGEKIFPICNNTAYLAMAGDEAKFVKFYRSIDLIKQMDDFNVYANRYWRENHDESPDQLLVLSKDMDVVSVDSYGNLTNDIYRGFDHCTYVAKDDENILFLAVGSGAEAFLGISHQINDELNKQYKAALDANSLPEWEGVFIKKIKSIYSDIHRHIASVGAEVDVVSLEL